MKVPHAPEFIERVRLRRWLPYAILLLGLLPLFVPFLASGHPLGHDREVPYLRVLALESAVSEGQLPPRWFAEFDGGYGSPYPSFYAMLFYWVAAGFSAAGLPVGLSVELAACLVIVLSAVSMFFFIRGMWGAGSGVLAALLFAYAPYHLVDLFVRGAYSELAAFIWFPLLLGSLYGWLRSPRRRTFAVAAASIAGLVLTHNLMALVFLPIAFIVPGVAYGLRRLWRERRLLGYGVLWAAGLGLSAYFWLPIVLEGQYVQLSDFLRYDFHGDFVAVRELVLASRGHTMALEIGPVLGVGVAASMMLVASRRLQIDHRRMYFALAGSLLLVLLLTTRYAEPVWAGIPFLPFLQFPWRFLGPASFFAAAVCGPLVRIWKPGWLGAGIGVALVLTSMFVYRELIQLPKSISASELEAIPVCEEVWGTQDYRPVWTHVPFWRGPMPPATAGEGPWMEPCQGTVQVWGDGEADTRAVEQHGTTWDIEYRAEGDMTLSIPQYFYPGWVGSVAGTPLDVTASEGEGLVSVSLPQGANHLRIEYSETVTRKAANAVSLAALLGLVLALLLPVAGLARLPDGR